MHHLGEIEGFGQKPEEEITKTGMGMLLLAPKESVDYIGKREEYQGKPREQWHPYDRKSGTGRGKELPKGGHGRGNWGNLRDELALGEPAITSTWRSTAPSERLEFSEGEKQE